MGITAPLAAPLRSWLAADVAKLVAVNFPQRRHGRSYVYNRKTINATNRAVANTTMEMPIHFKCHATSSHNSAAVLSFTTALLFQYRAFDAHQVVKYRLL